MKRFFMFLSLALFLVACEEKITPEIKIDSTEFTIPVTGSEEDPLKITFDANVCWKAALKQSTDWCTISPASGVAGPAYVNVIALENNTNEARSVTLVLTAETAVKEITITQLQKDAFELLEASAEVGAEGGDVNITVMTNVPWTLTIPSEVTWVKDVTTRAYGEDSKTVRVDPYDERDNSRSVELTITAEGFNPLTFALTQNGPQSSIWYKNVTDIDGYVGGTQVKLAKYGDKLVVLNGEKAFLLNALTGAKESEFNLPVAIDNLCIDDAGNIIVGMDADWGGSIQAYTVADPTNPQPVLFFEWDTANYYGSDAGNLRVKGDITKNAVITATVSAGAGGAMLYWYVTDGVLSNWYWTNVPYAGNSIKYACSAPAGDKTSDGFFYIGYGEDDRDFYFLKEADPDKSTNEWVKSYVTETSSNDNHNCIATATYKNKKYAAILRGAHFTWCNPVVILLDVTTPSAANKVFDFSCANFVHRDESWANLDWTGVGAYSDVLLVPTEDALLMYYVDANFNVIGCSQYK